MKTVIKISGYRMLSVLLLLAMLLTAAACTETGTTTGTDTLPATDGPAPVTQPDTEPETFDPDFPPYDPTDSWTLTSTLPTIAHTFPKQEVPSVKTELVYTQGNSAFTLKNAETSGTTVTLKNQTVSALNVNKSFEDGTTAVYEMTVQTTPTLESGWNTLYFGLRLENGAADATSQSGVWISLLKDKIGMRVGTWPNTSYLSKFPDDIDFSASPRRLIIEDDMDTDVITVSTPDEDGDPILLATVKIENGSINMYAPGADTPKLSDKITDSIRPQGCMNVWLHHVKSDATITDFKATGGTYVPETAPDANMMATRDVFADTWVSTDDEGRITPSGTGAVTDKQVGIFYFIWHDTNDPKGNNPLFDHAKTYYEGGLDALHQVMTQGNLGFAHYWAEPYFGYYRSNDEWVIRRHTMQLNAAGVDFIFIDATNGLTYEKNYEAILKVWSEMRAEGYVTPRICFHCGNDDTNAAKSFNALWNNLYSTGRYSDLWYLFDGKPLIFLPQSLQKKLDAQKSDFFTVRHSWANTSDSWYRSLHGRSCWPWADMYPQKAGLSPSGKAEQMIVMSGFWVNGSYGTNAGRSYHDGKQPSLDRSLMGFDLVDEGISGKGYGFEEQFDYAISQDPGLIMLVGWNEWWAGRWEAGPALGQTIANSYTVVDNNTWMRHYFVDNFNPEFSRDIEPVKGFYNDNYYYQMTQNVRDYKGSRMVPAAFGRRPIDMNGSIGQWFSVGPEFRDYTGDTAHRDAYGYVGGFHYVNMTGRNDFATMKVSKYGDDVWFYAECADNITAPSGTNWMNLFIDADCSAATGWYGYDYVLNRTQDGSACSIMKFIDNTWRMEEIGRAEYVVNGKTIQIHVTASALGLGDTFDFKWADNSVDDGDVMQFLDLGDTAPNDRFNYRYTTVTREAVVPSCLTEDMIVLKAGSYTAYADGKAVMLDKSNTRAVFIGDGEKLLIPKAFAADVLKLDTQGAETYDHYGVIYVDAAPLLKASGRTVTLNLTGNLVVIGPDSVSEGDMTVLERSLY